MKKIGVNVFETMKAAGFSQEILKTTQKGFDRIIFSFYSHTFKAFHPASLRLLRLLWLTLDWAALTCQNQRFCTANTKGGEITTQSLGHCYTPKTKPKGVELKKIKEEDENTANLGLSVWVFQIWKSKGRCQWLYKATGWMVKRKRGGGRACTADTAYLAHPGSCLKDLCDCALKICLNLSAFPHCEALKKWRGWQQGNWKLNNYPFFLHPGANLACVCVAGG